MGRICGVEWVDFQTLGGNAEVRWKGGWLGHFEISDGGKEQYFDCKVVLAVSISIAHGQIRLSLTHSLGADTTAFR